MIGVSRETRGKLDRFAALIEAENERQNLIAASTVPTLWDRHIVDALQLLPLIPDGDILDIGSGAGLPGIVLACARGKHVHLVEPRTRRAAFLSRVRDELKLANVTIWQRKVERMALPPVRCITARAVAQLAELFAAARHLSDDQTVWVLPKGRSAHAELEAARQSWQGVFELIPSRTDPAAAIVVAHSVRRRPTR